MKYLPLIWAGLWRKPLRATLTILSLAVAFLLFGILQGVGAGFSAVAAAAKLDRLYIDPRFGAPMPLSYTDQIASVPGVKLVAPRSFLYGYFQDPKNYFSINVSDERYFGARDELPITPQQIETWRKTRDGIVVGTGTAARLNMKVGDQITIHTSNAAKPDGSHDFSFQIVAIVDDVRTPGQGDYSVANYEYVNEIRADHKNEVVRFLVIVDDPKQITQVGKAIDKLFANSAAPTRAQSDRAEAQFNAGAFGDINFYVDVIVGSVLFMLLFLTANTMMQSFNERIPDFAVLKTLGFTDGAVFALIVVESLVQCLLGAVAGLAVAKISMPVLQAHATFFRGMLILPWLTVAGGLGVAIVVALVSGLVPAWRAKRLDVIDALAGRQ